VGEGAALTEPDVAYVTVGVQTRDATARGAQSANGAAVAAVLAAVEALGIAPADVRTSGVGLQPLFDREPMQVTGYLAANSVRVTVRDPARAGAVLEAAVAAGANQAGNVQFARLDDGVLRQRAIEEAVRVSRGKAEAAARGAGLRLGALVSVTEQGSSTQPPGAGPLLDAASAAGKGGASLEPGQLVVRATVTVAYAVQP
jgi:uncharacterized protein